MTTILLILGTLILLAMTGYTIYLLMQLRKQKRLFAQAKQARMNRIKESVTLIAKAMLVGDCNHSEGVIRLKMLLDPLGQKRLVDYSAMWQLYEIVQDMPTHDARKTLKKNERMRLDLQRESKESELEQHIKLEIQQLLEDIK
ncbi:DUF2489 domain-containing protein [Lonepinella koalarum]|uniref:Uncharacterized protein DUF2489 n=1 Tax=Lonepinella koalarum TaxID=53417 RepID=A0A4R1L2E0_9PAST|nr:DUF2489 domain-containing protein [Lonepinella koalarum]MDH2925911.1 hypothetical protein [Lonepinella koalarum]TCK71063.1 uncharacterized protein DUF2489 [Lonepinella koalarum]